MDESERSLSKYYFSEGNYAAVHDVLSHFASQRYRIDIDASGTADRILDVMKAVYDTRAPFSGDYERYILTLNQRVISEVFKHVEHLSAASQRKAPSLSERPAHTTAEDRSDIVRSYKDAIDSRRRALESAISGTGKRTELRSDVVISRPEATAIEPESVDGPNNTMEMLARMEADRKRMDEGGGDPPLPHSKDMDLPQQLDPIPEVDEKELDTPGGTMEEHLQETAPKRRMEVHAQVSDPPRLAVPKMLAAPKITERQSLTVSLDAVEMMQSKMQDRFESWTEALLRAVADVKKDITSAREAAPRAQTEVLSSLARKGGDLSSWVAAIPCAARVTHMLIPTTPAVQPFGRVNIGGVETIVTPTSKDEAFTRLELAAPVDIQAGDAAIKLLDCLGLPLPIPLDRCAVDSVSQRPDSLLIGVKSDHGLRTGDQVRLQGMSGSPGLVAELHRPEGHPAIQVDRRHFQVRVTDEGGPVTGLGEAINMKRQVYLFFDRLA
ncbi:hypothetical protein CVIRNUC_003354 [Coccomyxa viridis]|uniref:Uncharacterized protein n=1 Tax=Coccomyxa viridis TaxID=1274662 RepID=A0AAV1HYC3_9CHLO|nr:hypothetical protein CVIRNUC_003354 [Coccomyxa viridis]